MIHRYLYLFGVWEPNLSCWFDECLRPGDVFVDVGANIGIFSLLASKAVGEKGEVVAVEASPTVFDFLASNVARNGCKNIRLMNCAASDRTGVVRMFRAPDSNLGATSTFNGADFQEDGEVAARPLSDVLTTEETQKARLIKIDVEGAEAEVVKGLLPLLRIARRDMDIIVEVGGGPIGSPSAEESAGRIIPLLAREGFNVYKIENDYGASTYRLMKPPTRPLRVRDLSAITQECDLIFSRRDEPIL